MKHNDEIRHRLQAREQELETALQRFSEEARNSGDEDVQDEVDRATTSEAKTGALDLGTREYAALRDVQAALARLEDGTYGTCIVCGKPIEPARLAAIPETPYCLEHADAGNRPDAEGQPRYNM